MASLARPTANRAIHLRITPRPSTLGESREIMRLLSRFGEVEYFKSLRYEALSAPSAALVIYKEEKAARECFKRSPIRFRMGRVLVRQQQSQPGEERDEEPQHGTPSKPSSTEQRLPRGPIGTPFGVSSSQTRALSTSSLPTPPPNPIRMPFDPPPPSDPAPRSSSVDNSDSRLFQIITSPTNRNFRDTINAGPFHGNFSLHSKSFPGQEDLAKRVPLLGLSRVDWMAADRPWRVVEAEKKKFSGRGRLGGLVQHSKKKADSGGPGLEEYAVGVGVRTDLPTDEQDVATSITDAPMMAEDYGKSEIIGQKHDTNEPVPNDEDSLKRAVKGWEQFFPGISSNSDPVERYSRKRK